MRHKTTGREIIPCWEMASCSNYSKQTQSDSSRDSLLWLMTYRDSTDYRQEAAINALNGEIRRLLLLLGRSWHPPPTQLWTQWNRSSSCQQQWCHCDQKNLWSEGGVGAGGLGDGVLVTLSCLLCSWHKPIQPRSVLICTLNEPVWLQHLCNIGHSTGGWSTN